MKTIKKSYLIKAPVEEVWKALVDKEYIEGWGAAPAKMDDQVGTKFTLWAADIFGKNLEVSPNKQLVQEWWSKDERWDEPSEVTFTLVQKGKKIELTMVQKNVPDKDKKSLDEGWDDFYLTPLKKFLESK